MANLYIVATPIGNLGDITIRALDVLKSADFILCEDTRVTEKLLSHYEIKKQVLSYHQHSELSRVGEILDLLKTGKNLALVSDAGTPGIADPGNKLIEEIMKCGLTGVNIVPIPGACALATAASVSGFNMDKFVFMGFPPAKNKRKKFFEKVVASEFPVIFYESTYKILKALEELKSLAPDLEMAVFRELTKKFETIYRGKIGDVLAGLKTGETRGEFVVIVNH
jgi:16S rRNA (cytidine1402-2'-O)-methyltransferase